MCFIFKNNEIKVLIFLIVYLIKTLITKLKKNTRKISNINKISISNILFKTRKNFKYN